MKKICILLFMISLMMPICLHGQISVYGEIPTTAHSNSIIRAWGNQFVIYAEDNYGQGVFHLLTGTTGGSQVFTANLPSLLYVYDFKILGDNVYFVGVRDTSTIVGVFNITSLFYYNGGYDLCELQAYSKYPNLYSPKALLRTEVYFYDGIVHIVAVGSQSVNGVYTTAVFDIPYPYTGVYKAVSSDVGYSEGVFYDLALTDNYIVSVAHKGTPYDPLSTGYLMFRTFQRDSDPLSSISGEILHNTDSSNKYPNGIMAAVGLVGDSFAISYCEPGPTATEQEIGILEIIPGNSIISLLFKRTNNYLNNSSYYSFKDLFYNVLSNQLCDIGNGNAFGNYCMGIYPTSGAGASRLSLVDISINSQCTLSTNYCAASGTSSSSLLGIILQELPINNSCAAISNESMPEIPMPVIKQNKGIIVDRGGMYDPYLFFPVITPNNFYVICTKDF